jgi:hypothetical protein
MQRQPVDNDVLPANELRHQYAIPEVDVFAVLSVICNLICKRHDILSQKALGCVLSRKYD